MRCKNIFILVFSMLLLGVVSASFTFSENGSSIVTNYEGMDYLQGGINISFFDESLNSTFSDSLGNTIKLNILLDKNTEYNYLYTDLTNTTISSAFQVLDMQEASFLLPGAIKSFTYTLKLGDVKVFDKTLQIMSSENLIAENLIRKYKELNKTEFEILKYDSFVQKILNESIGVSSIEINLKKIETESENTQTVEVYNQLLNNLSQISIPKDISETTNTNPISFYPLREKINLDVLQEIGGGNIGNNQNQYLDAIYTWNNKIKTAVKFEEMDIDYGSNNHTILNVFEIQFDKSVMDKDSYFIIENMQNLKFENLDAQIMSSEDDMYKYINLNDVTDKIVFSTTDQVSFLNLPAFISPALGDLAIPKAGTFERFTTNSKSKWILFAIIIFILLLIAVVAYILLQRWYRLKYEQYLFKNKNNLYNIMNYIQNAKKNGAQRENIIKDLKKANWTGEQIKYALNKYEGKKIAGIIDRPFNKVLNEIGQGPSEGQKNVSKVNITKV